MRSLTKIVSLSVGVLTVIGCMSPLFAEDPELYRVNTVAEAGNIFEERGPAQVELPSQPVCGDADGDGIVNVSDVVALVGYVFRGTALRDPIAADADCNGIVNVGDFVKVIAYVFGGGPEPDCSACQPVSGPAETTNSSPTVR